jgi:hypothetical protein
MAAEPVCRKLTHQQTMNTAAAVFTVALGLPFLSPNPLRPGARPGGAPAALPSRRCRYGPFFAESRFTAAMSFIRRSWSLLSKGDLSLMWIASGLPTIHWESSRPNPRIERKASLAPRSSQSTHGETSPQTALSAAQASPGVSVGDYGRHSHRAEEARRQQS